MPRSDDLVDIVKFRLLERHFAELERLKPLKTPYSFRRQRYLDLQIQRLQFELGQYELTR